MLVQVNQNFNLVRKWFYSILSTVQKTCRETEFIASLGVLKKPPLLPLEVIYKIFKVNN